MSEDFKFTQFIVFLFARCLFGEFFDDFRHCNVLPSEGKCLQRSVNSSTPVLSFENCHKSYNSKKHINEHFLSTVMDHHVLNSKTTPQAARGCGIRRQNFWLRPFHDVTRSPGYPTLASFAAVFRLVPPHKRLLNRAIHSFPGFSQSHFTYYIPVG